MDEVIQRELESINRSLRELDRFGLIISYKHRHDRLDLVIHVKNSFAIRTELRNTVFGGTEAYMEGIPSDEDLKKEQERCESESYRRFIESDEVL